MNTTWERRLPGGIRSSLGWSEADDLCVIEVSGRDAAGYLQGRTTNDVKKLAAGQGHPTSILDRKGHILAVFSLHCLEEQKFYLIAGRNQASTIMSLLESCRFREQVGFKDITAQYRIVSVQGPLSDSLVLSGQAKPTALPSEQYAVFSAILWGSEAIVVRMSLTGESGFLILCRDVSQDSDGRRMASPLLSNTPTHVAEHHLADTSAERLEDEPAAADTPAERLEDVPAAAATFSQRLRNELAARSAVEISESDAEVLRIEAGLLKFGVDITGGNILPETGLEQTSVSYDKGCFPGQEVLARIKTYGAPKHAIVGLIFQEPTAGFEFDTPFQIQGADAGFVKSSCQSPTLGKYIAIAYIVREYRVPDRKLTISIAGKDHEVSVSLLPFVDGTNVHESAKKLYNSALEEFAKGSEEEAVGMLRRCLQLDPLFGDAYESLGVMLARHGKHDEAIALMKKLGALDPESIMAHANLSMFYMELGDKEQAEEERALALGIQMTRIARDVAAKQKQDEDKAQKFEEMRNRMSMFQQVLQIDQNDLLANYGLGDANVQLGNYAEALPFLRKAIQLKPSYTVAYLALGKALENLQQTAEAITIYEQGIEVAARKGDFSPMNEMKSHLAAIRANTSAVK